jgi:hypothetical protein
MIAADEAADLGSTADVGGRSSGVGAYSAASPGVAGSGLRITSGPRGGMRKSPRSIEAIITRRCIWRNRSESMRRKSRRRFELV